MIKKLICIFAAAAIIFLSSCSSYSNTDKETEKLPSLKIEETTAAETDNPNAKNYILNKRSKKIHFPDCYSVDLMAEHNKKYVFEAIEDIISRGYTPCENCNPY